MMSLAMLGLAAGVLFQQPGGAPKPVPVPILDAKLGTKCSADFTVNDEEVKPVYDATVHVRVRYGFAGIKRSDLEVGTNSEGKARIQGLPDKAKPLAYDIT